MNPLPTCPNPPSPGPREGSFTGGWLWAVARDLRLARRHPDETLLTVAFFALVAAFFPLAIGPEPQLLTRIGPGVIWVAALLAAFLALPALFAGDHLDGTLEQMVLSPHPPTAWALGKVAAHWLVTGVPLVVLSPLIGLQYGLTPDTLVVQAASLALGTPLLSLLGGACAALALGARGGGTLLAVLAFPLFVPVLIFGAGATEAQAMGMAPDAQLSLLGAGLLLALLAIPFAIVAALKIAVD